MYLFIYLFIYFFIYFFMGGGGYNHHKASQIITGLFPLTTRLITSTREARAGVRFDWHLAKPIDTRWDKAHMYQKGGGGDLVVLRVLTAHQGIIVTGYIITVNN